MWVADSKIALLNAVYRSRAPMEKKTYHVSAIVSDTTEQVSTEYTFQVIHCSNTNEWSVEEDHVKILDSTKGKCIRHLPHLCPVPIDSENSDNLVRIITLVLRTKGMRDIVHTDTKYVNTSTPNKIKVKVKYVQTIEDST